MDETADTRQRILNTAAQQYASVGYEAMSLRTLTEAAGVNLAAVNYHFGSKKALFVTLVRESIHPVNAERIRRLDLIADRYSTEPPPAEDVIDAYLRPLFEQAGAHQESQTHFLRMVGRVLTEPEDFWKLFEEGSDFHAVTSRFTQTLRQSLPHLPADEVEWRFFFMVSTLIGSFVQCRHVTNNCRCNIAQSDLNEMLRRMSTFITGGCHH